MDSSVNAHLAALYAQERISAATAARRARETRTATRERKGKSRLMLFRRSAPTPPPAQTMAVPRI